MAQRKKTSFPTVKALLILLVLFIGSTMFYQGQRPINPEALNGTYDTTDTQGEFHGQSFISSAEDINPLPHQVLGLNDQEKHIEVDLTHQRLYAFEGNQKILDVSISSGKWGATPTGIFHIWGKFKYTKMSGGSRARGTYYYLPNVPFVMFFSNDKVAPSRGFSLHGTYWHSNFGHPMSHGCINMRTEDAEILFNWTGPNIGSQKSGKVSKDNPGTLIVIYGETPRE